MALALFSPQVVLVVLHQTKMVVCPALFLLVAVEPPNENDGVGTSAGFAIGGGTAGAAVTDEVTAAVVAPNENDGFVDSVGVATTGGTMGVAPNDSIGGA